MKKFKVFLVALLAMAVLVPAAFAQMGTVKGYAKDQDGKPMVGAVIQFQGLDNGRHYEMKTDKKGNYFSMGVASGNYDVTVMYNGQQVDKVSRFPVQSNVGTGGDNELNFDLQKEAQQAESNKSPDQKKAEEQAAQSQKNAAEKVKNLNNLLAQAKTASEAGNYQQAKELMLQATAQDTTHEVLFFQLAEAERNLGNHSSDAEQKKTELTAALDSYNKALALTPSTKPDVKAAILNNMGETYFKLGNVDQAIKSYDAAAEADPTGAAKFYFNEGAVLTNAGKYDEAIAAFDKCIAADPTKADAYYQKGVNLIGKATTKPDGSMVAPPGTADAFNKYLELAPNGPYADAAKQMLAAIGSKVETTYGKSKAKK